MAELIVFVTLNITGFPCVGNPPPGPFKGWGGNEFGWPFVYHSTAFTPSQWEQMRRPDGGFLRPNTVALKPTTIFTSLDSVEFTPARTGWNGFIVCVILFWTALTLELWLAPGQRFHSVFFWLLALMVCAIVLLSQSGTFYYYCYVPSYYPWKHAMRFAGVTFMFAPAIGLMLRRWRTRLGPKSNPAATETSTEENLATNSPYVPPETKS